MITYYQTRNRIILARRYGSSLDYAKYLIGHLIYAVAWALLTPLRGKSALHTAHMTLAGVLDAIRGRMGKTFAPEAVLRPTQNR